MQFAKELVVTLSVFLSIDLVWLLVIAKDFYAKNLSVFERSTRLAPAALVYLLIPLGLVIFVLPRSVNNDMSALIYGGLFGLITYGVYDLTNYATLKNWPLTVVLVDILWGMFICGISALIVKKLLAI